MQPHSSQCYPLKRTRSNSYKLKYKKSFFFFPYSDQVAQKGFVVSILDGTQNTTGQGPKQSALFEPTFSRAVGQDKL